MMHLESEGPPLVLIHGAGANAAVWEPLHKPFSSFDLYAPDLPGRLGSEGPARDRAEEAACSLDAKLEAVGVRDAIVLGHSYGGAVAIELALRSSRVAALVLVASGARLRVHPSILEGAERAVSGAAPLPVDFCFTPHTSRDVIEAYARAASPTPPEATLADWRACDAFDRRSELERIGVPVLVTTGAEDALTPPKYQRYLVEHLPRAQLELVERTGHMLPWEQPAKLAAIVRAWASGVG